MAASETCVRCGGRGTISDENIIGDPIWLDCPNCKDSVQSGGNPDERCTHCNARKGDTNADMWCSDGNYHRWPSEQKSEPCPNTMTDAKGVHTCTLPYHGAGVCSWGPGSKERTATSQLTPEEIAYARAADKLWVEANGMGFVDTEWLTRWRQQSSAREELTFIISYLAHNDQDANHAWMVRRIRAVLAGNDPRTVEPWNASDGVREPRRLVGSHAEDYQLARHIVRAGTNESLSEAVKRLKESKMTLDITGKEKPVYEEGAEIVFNINGTTKGRGWVRGRASEGLIDLWIVQYDPEKSEGIDPALYPWSCLVIPHTLLHRA